MEVYNMYITNIKKIQNVTIYNEISPTQFFYLFLTSISLFICIFFIWANISKIDEVVNCKVILRPMNPESSIKSINSGQIYSKYFQNDDEVSEGDLLFTLDATVYKTELDAYQKELLKNTNDAFINEIILQTIENESLPQISNNSDAYVRANSYITELQRYQAVISDVKTKLEREQNKPQSLKVPQNITDLQNQLNQNELAFESWKNNQKIAALDTKKALQSAKNSIESRITELERAIKNSTIYAPISGRISEVTKLNIGDYLLAGEEILRIIPQNDKKLKADIFVDPSYVARIKVGNPIKIKFPGLPPSRYGMVETEVSLVPPDVTYQNGTAVFVIEAQIDSPYLIAKNGQTAKLIPGITAEGRIVTDRSTVMQMVLRKLDFIN